MTPPASTSTSNSTSTSTPRPPQRTPACQQCRRRKGKCDFKEPCTPCSIRGEASMCEYLTNVAPERRARKKHPLRQSDVDRLKAQVSHLQALLQRTSPPAEPELDAAMDSLGEQLNSLVLDHVLFQRDEEAPTDEVLSHKIRALFSSPYSHLPPEPPSSYDLFFPSPPTEIVETLQRLFPSGPVAFRLLESFYSFSNRVHGPVDHRAYTPRLQTFYRNPSDPSVQDVGFLSSMLAIFAHGLSSMDTVDSAVLDLDPDKSRHANVARWLTGSLQGISHKMSAPSGSVGIETLRAVGLVSWFCFFFGDDSLVRPAVSLNAKALFVACDGYTLHRDPKYVHINATEEEREDYRRIFWFLTTMDWTMCSVIGRSYSPVPFAAINVAMPSYIPGRDPSEEMISNLCQHIEGVRILWRISLSLYAGSISLARYQRLEAELDQVSSNITTNFNPLYIRSADQIMDGPASARFTQCMLISVQTRAAYCKLHGPLAVPKPGAPQWVKQAQPQHLMLCVTHARGLLALQRQQLSGARRHKGHSGFPRFHPIYGSLILAGLLLACPNMPEREQVSRELEEFVPFVRSFKRLSAITTRGAEVLQGVLNEVRSRGSSTDSTPESHESLISSLASTVSSTSSSNVHSNNPNTDMIDEETNTSTTHPTTIPSKSSADTDLISNTSTIPANVNPGQIPGHFVAQTFNEELTLEPNTALLDEVLSSFETFSSQNSKTTIAMNEPMVTMSAFQTDTSPPSIQNSNNYRSAAVPPADMAGNGLFNWDELFKFDTTMNFQLNDQQQQHQHQQHQQ